MNAVLPPVTVFWFRRDLRLRDNAGLYYALKNHQNVLPVFIFDQNILRDLPQDDLRVQFIHESVQKLKNELQQKGSVDVYKKLIQTYKVQAIYANHDYEPAAIRRDEEIKKFCDGMQIQFLTYKDHCIFEKKEVLTDQQKNYTVFTPYKKKWLASLSEFYLRAYPNEKYEENYFKTEAKSELISLERMNFRRQEFQFPEKKMAVKMLSEYALKRDFPFLENATSKLGIHFRFGTISPRKAVRETIQRSPTWVSELIWRDFFMQVLWHYPHVEKSSFKPQFEKVAWRSNPAEFERWCEGQTGYPLVDAGMRELNQTGHMHNRVRMVVASFLTKHLLMHWSLGERYFAKKLLDYDMAANNGNWQWAAGTGCDAAPYFRIFNPSSQFEKFDPEAKYVKKWVPEFGTEKYIRPMVDHTFARDRALEEFKRALK
jgi:deoxyribodipyrimidine photo-lyase